MKSIIRILTTVCLDLLSLVNSLHTLFKILIFRVWQYWKYNLHVCKFMILHPFFIKTCLWGLNFIVNFFSSLVRAEDFWSILLILTMLSSFRLRNTDNSLVQQQPWSKLAYKNSYQSKVFLSNVLLNITDWRDNCFTNNLLFDFPCIAERIGDDIMKLPQFDVLIFIHRIYNTVNRLSAK